MTDPITIRCPECGEVGVVDPDQKPSKTGDPNDGIVCSRCGFSWVETADGVVRQ